ncbi:MAG: hypothetical protein RMJ88_16715 [Thermogemmata sp.]|nr:hypothetical protein [Thermogemmata sp.]
MTVVVLTEMSQTFSIDGKTGELAMLYNRSIHTSRSRYVGLTLVEVLVVMALTLLIMWLLAEAFRVGSQTLSQARASAQLMNQLSMNIGPMLMNDLSHGCFYISPSFGNGYGQRLSAITFSNPGPGGIPFYPPKLSGFFRVKAPASPSQLQDDNGYAIYRITNHLLHFTTILPATERPFVFWDANATRAAEIAYFLAFDTRNPLPTGPAGEPLYRLVRCKTNLPVELLSASPQITLPPLLPAPANSYNGEIVLDNVLSMELKLYTNSPVDDTDVDWPYTFFTEFNTASPPRGTYRLLGLQITLRICDPKTGTIRQNSWRFRL